jgi:hypothetical protein
MNKERVLHEVAVLFQGSILALNEKAKHFYESGAIDVDSYMDDSDGGADGRRQVLAQILATAAIRDLADIYTSLANEKILSELENLKHFKAWT